MSGGRLGRPVADRSARLRAKTPYRQCTHVRMGLPIRECPSFDRGEETYLRTFNRGGRKLSLNCKLSIAGTGPMTQSWQTLWRTRYHTFVLCQGESEMHRGELTSGGKMTPFCITLCYALQE